MIPLIPSTLRNPRNGKHRREQFLSWLEMLGRGIERSVVGSGTAFAIITSLGLTVMILMGTIDVIGTKLFNSPLPATLEATESLMLVITFGGLAFVQQQRRNITVDLLVIHFSSRARTVCELAGYLVGFAFFALLTWRSGLFFWESFVVREYAEGIVPFPRYPTKFVMLLGSGLVTIQLIVDIFLTVRRLWGKGPTPPQM